MDLGKVRDIEIALEKDIYKKSYYQFFLAAFPQIEIGIKFKDNWHVKYLCDKLQEEAERIWRGEKRKKHLIINVPPRSAKSLICTIIFPVWCWANNPRTKFITTSFSQDLASEHSQKSKDLIHSQWFQRLYGDKVIINPSVNAKTFYATTEGGMRKAVGTGGQITGSGCDIFVCFDFSAEVKTDKGYLKIGDIVENKLPVKICSYNHSTKKEEYKTILNYWKNPIQSNRMIRVGIKGADGKTKEIICTENHNIFTKEEGYVKAKDLKPHHTLIISQND